MADSIKSKAISGLIWSAVERFSVQGIQFFIGIIMARLLIPADYGMIAMLAIFMAISQSFVDSGFSSALIQKKDRSEVDYSTVFYFNIGVAVLLYVILFFSAPFIASFYNLPQLSLITRVLSINLIVNSLAVVQRTKLTVQVDFKTQAKATLAAVVLSGGCGIWLAYNGFGVWSLVFQSIANACLNTLLLFVYTQWRPRWVFSVQSFNSLFFFGSKVLISGMIHTVYSNLYTLTIGRFFTASSLGYFTRADQLAQFPSGNIASVLSRVTLPILSSIQDDDARLHQIYRKYLCVSTYVVFPLMVGIAALGKPLIHFLLGDNWNGAVLLLQILCFAWIWDPVCNINVNLLYVKGRSDLVLRLEIVKKTIAIAILFCSLPFGVPFVCAGRVLYSLIAVILNTYYTQKLIHLSFWTQMRDILPAFILSLSGGVLVGGSVYFISADWGQLLVGALLGTIFYLAFSYWFRFKALQELLALLKQKQKK